MIKFYGHQLENYLRMILKRETKAYSVQEKQKLLLLF